MVGVTTTMTVKDIVGQVQTENLGVLLANTWVRCNAVFPLGRDEYMVHAQRTVNGRWYATVPGNTPLSTSVRIKALADSRRLFFSEPEKQRWADLLDAQAQGAICRLSRWSQFILINGFYDRAGNYEPAVFFTPSFEYWDVPLGQHTVECIRSKHTLHAGDYGPLRKLFKKTYPMIVFQETIYSSRVKIS